MERIVNEGVFSEVIDDVLQTIGAPKEVKVPR